jgi:RNA polymerase sigma factor (sigma-70 family)
LGKIKDFLAQPPAERLRNREPAPFVETRAPAAFFSIGKGPAMTSAIPNERDSLIHHLRTIRLGREAKESLESMLRAAESSRKALRLNWLEALDEAMEEAAPSVSKPLRHANCELIHRWFDQLSDHLGSRILQQLAGLATFSGSCDPIKRLFDVIRDGRKSEETFAAIVWDGLRRRTPSLANLLTPADSHSDVVQKVTVKIVDWAVRDFRGTTDAQFWAAAGRSLAREAIEIGRRPAVPQISEYTDLTVHPDRERDSADDFLDSEFKQAVDRCINTWPPLDRLLFRLHHDREISYSKIAAMLGAGETEESIGRRVRELRDALHRQMRDNSDGIEKQC